MLSSANDLDVRPVSRAFRALGDETRLRIVALLAHGELCVCHVEQALGLTQPNASRQLGILKSAGVADSRRDGPWVYYRIADEGHEIVRQVLDVLGSSLATGRALKSDLVKLRRAYGPEATK